MTADDDDIELDADALAMLAAYRDEEVLPPRVQTRVWQRVQSDVAVPVSFGVAKWAVVMLVAAAAVVATVVGVQAMAPTEGERAVQQAPYERAARPSDGVTRDGEERRPERKHRPGAGAPDADVAADPAPPEGEEAEPLVEPGPDDAVTAVDANPPAAEPDPSSASPAASTDAPNPGAARRRRPAVRGDHAGQRAPPTDAPARPAPAAPSSPAEPSPSAASPTPPTPPAAEPPTVAETLAEETRLLKRAQAAVRAGKPSQALAILATCKRRFPRGVLAEERAALRVIALCDAGRHDEGKTAAEGFLRSHPGSALAGRVRKACKR